MQRTHRLLPTLLEELEEYHASMALNYGAAVSILVESCASVAEIRWPFVRHFNLTRLLCGTGLPGLRGNPGTVCFAVCGRNG